LAKRHTHDGSNETQLGNVFVCDIELEKELEKDMDRLLSLFSCAMPALMLRPNHELHRELETRTNEWTSSEEWCAFLAHCTSFKELQSVASLRKKHWEDEVQ
jgi:hypothetical protein